MADLLFLSDDPRNAEPLPETLTESFITPVERLYIRTHGTTPEIAASGYALTVDGLVENPLRLSLADLGRFERVEAAALLCCAGNRRTEMHALAPTPGEEPWGPAALGTGLWRGVRLADVLAEAGVQDGAAHVAFESVDEVEKDGRTFGYGSSIPLAKALAPEVLLADGLDGRPLTPDHGAPLRAVVPGFIGARSVKWLGRVTVQREESSNHFQKRAYKLFPPEVEKATADWDSQPAIQDLPLNAVLTRPGPNEALRPGTVRLQGYAYSGGGRAVRARRGLHRWRRDVDRRHARRRRLTVDVAAVVARRRSRRWRLRGPRPRLRRRARAAALRDRDVELQGLPPQRVAPDVPPHPGAGLSGLWRQRLTPRTRPAAPRCRWRRR